MAAGLLAHVACSPVSATSAGLRRSAAGNFFSTIFRSAIVFFYGFFYGQ
jgi:hypothetical protein